MANKDDSDLRPGEIAVALPPAMDAGVYFIGRIRTPWRSRQDCPKRGSADGPVCSIVVDEHWRTALTGLAGHPRIQVLYWMNQARRDLVLQAPRQADEFGRSDRHLRRCACRCGPIRSPRPSSMWWRLGL